MSELQSEIKNLKQRVSELEDKIEDLTSERKEVVGSVTGETDKDLSIKEFIKSKNVNNYVDKVLVVAYYLEHYKNLTSFNVGDLESNFRRAKEPLPSNTHDKVNMAIRKGMIMETEEKKDNRKAWVVTRTGEEYVENKLSKSQ